MLVSVTIDGMLQIVQRNEDGFTIRAHDELTRCDWQHVRVVQSITDGIAFFGDNKSFRLDLVRLNVERNIENSFNTWHGTQHPLRLSVRSLDFVFNCTLEQLTPIYRYKMRTRSMDKISCRVLIIVFVV